jgi:hypothetical protein
VRRVEVYAARIQKPSLVEFKLERAFLFSKGKMMQIRLEAYVPGRWGGSIAREGQPTYQTLFRMERALAERSGRLGRDYRDLMLGLLRDETSDVLARTREILRQVETDVEAVSALFDSLEVEYLEGMLGTD